MELYLANFSGLDPKQARAAARSGRRGSVWGMSLLSSALERSLGLAALPELGEDAFGKPCFPAFPGLCFSGPRPQSFPPEAPCTAPRWAWISSVGGRFPRP